MTYTQTKPLSLGIFAPLVVREPGPEAFGGIVHESYFKADATWYEPPNAAAATYWGLIQLPSGDIELVKVLVASTEGLRWDSKADAVAALNGAFPGWVAVPVRGQDLTEAPF